MLPVEQDISSFYISLNKEFEHGYILEILWNKFPLKMYFLRSLK